MPRSRWPEERAGGEGWRAASRDITDPAERLLAIIAAGTGPDRQCHASVSILAGRAGIRVRSARRILARLVGGGRIARFRLPNGLTATMLTDPPRAANPSTTGEDL